MSTSAQTPRGFTLIEVVIGMFLIAVIASGAFACLRLGLGMIEDSRDQTRVSQILQAEMERLRLSNWGDIMAMPASSAFTLDNSFEDAFPGRYTGSRTVSERHPDAQVEIVLTVDWNTRGRANSRSFRTFFTKDGINDYYYRAL